jgi:hypothetical protein
MPVPSDTSPDAERVLIEGYRRMSPAEKLERVAALNRALVTLSTARLRAQYGAAMSPRELRLRLAALRLEPETMRTVLAWDPTVHGL